MKKNVKKSQHFHDTMFMLPQQCWRNSILMMLEVLDGSYSYIEGFFVDDLNYVYEHGWCQDFIEIIDVTKPENGLQYFPGVRYSKKEVRDNHEKGQEYPFVQYLGWYNHIDYARGYNAAAKVAWGFEPIQIREI